MGDVSETRCPQITTWPPAPLDPNLDKIARHVCLPIYVRIRTRLELLNLLAQSQPVVATFYLNLGHRSKAPAGLFVEYHSESFLRGTDRVYAQDYVTRLMVENGKKSCCAST